MNPASQKADIRARLLRQRKALSEAERRRRSGEISERLLGLPEFKSARRPQFYLATADEVETDRIVEAAIAFQKRVAVPVIDPKDSKSRSLVLSELTALGPERMEAGPFGIRQPRSEFQKEVALEEIDLWILPGVAFDPRGGRLGLGAGYYDRLLSRARGVRIGLAYDFQVIDRVPVDRNDQPVHLIVTEKRIIHCKEGHDGGADREAGSRTPDREAGS